MTAEEIIAALSLKPHPEGGWYAETFRDAPAADGRARVTAIHFLLKHGERSHWHRVDAVEMWLWHAGAALTLEISADGKRVDAHVLGADVLNGEAPQVIVPTHAWQAARANGDWTLVSCVVAPGFEFAGFELAAPDWAPG
jgi:predicted cupin superfamily sugar epimerase